MTSRPTSASRCWSIGWPRIRSGSRETWREYDRSGFYSGKHYTEYVDAVKDLKRRGRLDESVELLGHSVGASEDEARNNAGWGVAPWYYEQVSIIYAERGDVDAEVAILERYAAQPHAPGASLHR